MALHQRMITIDLPSLLAMKQVLAIAAWRDVQAILKRMEQISRILIFATTPDLKRRNPLTPEVLGLN